MRVLSNQVKNYQDKEISLFGWVDSRRDHGKLIFIDLRDRKGLVQVVFLPEHKEVFEKAKKLREEWVLNIVGQVKKRPANTVNKDIESGEFEIEAKELNILSQSETSPIPLDSDGYEIEEEIRLKYRYLDLRRKRMQKNIRLRSEAVNLFREYLLKNDFVEIETPNLSKSTPEGARDYLVPSRQHPGNFYALPQSPQQYKQLLMLAGFERYFQVARCFRDEDTRSDRQPEFTQLDIETSFMAQSEILGLIEKMFYEVSKKLFPEKKIDFPFPRIPYKEAMGKYGSDRPDLREDKNNKDELKFAFIVDFPMFEKREANLDRADLKSIWTSSHHPFTQPKLIENGQYITDKDKLVKAIKENPENVFSFQYDLILNGFEVGGGSLRSTDFDMLLAVFETLGHSQESIKEKFGHLLEAFRYGVPPHGGIAPGIDRYLAVALGEPSIREVIAFPKTGDGRDLMMGAPSKVDKEQLDELHLKVVKKED